MATETDERRQRRELQRTGRRIPADPAVLDQPSAAVTKRIRSATQRGGVTRGQIKWDLPSEAVNSDQIEDGLSISREIGVNTVDVLPQAETRKPTERSGAGRDLADPRNVGARPTGTARRSGGSLHVQTGASAVRWGR